MTELSKIGKALIPITLMTMTGLFAEAEIADNCCPKPCCVPEPKKCIDCESYNPQFYILQCDWGMFVQADFLYWYAAESNLEFARTDQFFFQSPQQGPPLQLGAPIDHHHLKSKWNAGVRVGIGMHSEKDGWDFLLNWTYLDNNTRGSKSDPLLNPNSDVTANGLIPGVIDPYAYNLAFGFNNPPQFQDWHAPEVSSKWSVIFNQLDLEIGKKFWVSKCFTLRPYTGIRGAWTHTNLRVTANILNVGENQSFILINTNLLKNRYWGVGILGGVQPQFVLGSWCGCGVFSLYGNFEGAALWGNYRGHNTYRFASITQVGDAEPVRQMFLHPHEEENFSRMQGILDLGIGIRWEEYWCCDRFLTTIDLGWEHHYWFDFGLYHRIKGGIAQAFNGVEFRTPTGSDNFVTNLGLGGFVLRFRLDF